MRIGIKQLSITQHGHYLSSETLLINNVIPFKDHPQFALLVDSLSRKDQHHLALFTNFSFACRLAFLQAFLLYLAHDAVPASLRHTEILLLDVEQLLHSKKQLTDADFEELQTALTNSHQHTLFVITHFDLLLKESNQLRHHFLRAQFELLLSHPKCRVILFTPNKLTAPVSLGNHQLTSVVLEPLSEQDHLAFLKLQRESYEQFHHVVIPDELLTHAYALANRFLNSADPLDNALLLLDSSAARASLSPNTTLTLQLMLQVLSSWIHIPASHLHIDQFNKIDFLRAMRERVYGQDNALSLLADRLQKSYFRLTHHSGVFCHVTLAGAAHTGKKTLALAFTEQLFKQLNVLYSAELTTHTQHIAAMTVKRLHDNQYAPLTDVLHKVPYAVLMFHVDENSPRQVLEQLNDIVTTGQLQDATGRYHSFYQTTIIINTTFGVDKLTSIAKTFTHDDAHLSDLFKIVMNESSQEQHKPHIELSEEDVLLAIKPDLASKLPPALCQYIIPFFPLQKSAIEKIIQQKLKVLHKQLNTHYQIELNYAPEAITYLSNMPFNNVDLTLKQLYACVEQALSSKHIIKGQSNQLFLQLNELGDMLRCDWMMEPTNASAS